LNDGQPGDNLLVKQASAFFCILALSAMLGACNKNKSPAANQDAGASASQAASAAGQGASDLAVASGAQARGAETVIGKSQLPAEAAETLRLIKAGGPYPFSEDGVLFRNSAVMLPQHARGYYRAYTVRTPGAADRGQRRIVCGGARKQINECYYTDDYYASFRRIGD
jgi:ribonuclease T1